MPSVRRGKLRSPPFSSALYLLALVEALLWVAPLLEAQNSDKTTFTFSLCDYLDREIVNLKSVAQRWRAEEKQEDIAQQANYDKIDPNEVETSQYQTYLKEVTEAKSYTFSSNASLALRMPHGRSKRLPATFREEQQKKDGMAYGAVKNRKGKGKETALDTAVYGSYFTLFTAVILSILALCKKGMRPLSLMSCLAIMSQCIGGAHAAPLETDPSTEPAAPSDHVSDTGFYLLGFLAPSKALFIIGGFVLILVYLLFCFWLSVGWLHFATRLLFGPAKVHSKDDENDPELAQPADAEEEDDEDIGYESETETRTLSSMRPGVMIDFKFKTNVLSDALVAYSSILNLSTLRSILSGQDDAGAPAAGHVGTN